MAKEHTLMLIMGRSGAGKDSLVNKLSERTNLTAITSYTTRPRRENEGNTHVFVTEDVFEEMIKRAELRIGAPCSDFGTIFRKKENYKGPLTLNAMGRKLWNKSKFKNMGKSKRRLARK